MLQVGDGNGRQIGVVDYEDHHGGCGGGGITNYPACSVYFPF